MMRKVWMRAASTALLTLSVVAGTAVPAFANYDPVEAGEETEAVKVEENIEETTMPEDFVPESLTPEGNMNLVDDLEGKNTKLQYMTVTTRDGSYFYIIIDRSEKEENVYFLNKVDAADLLALMSDEEKEAYEESHKEPETKPQETVPAENEKLEVTVQPEPETQEKPNPLASSLPMLGIFGGLGALAAGGYYVLKIKPKKNQPDIDEEREFYDDDEYENEDSVDESGEDE